jgi:hypothetical protein
MEVMNIRLQRRNLAYVFLLSSLLLSSFLVLSDLVRGESVSSMISSSGTITYGPSRQPKISTRYTGVTKTDADHISVSFSHLMYHPTNTLWDLSSSFGNSLGSGAPSVYMSDIGSGSSRAEYNIVNMQSQVGNEVYFSNWFFLPSDWVVPAGWYSIADPMQKSASPYCPYVELWITQPNPPAFTVMVGGRQGNDWQCIYMNKNGTLAQVNNFPLPRGRWFNITWWMRRDPTAGQSFIKVWWDGILICDQTAFPYETGPLNYVRSEGSYNSGTFNGPAVLTDLDYPNAYFTTACKIYHGGTSYIHQIWTDDLEIWDGHP